MPASKDSLDRNVLTEAPSTLSKASPTGCQHSETGDLLLENHELGFRNHIYFV